MFETSRVIASVAKHFVFITFITFIIFTSTCTNAHQPNNQLKNTINNNNNDHPFNSTVHKLRAKRTAYRDESRFYPFAIVPYKFHRGVSRTQRNIIQNVIEHYHDLSCIRFVPRVSRDGQWAKDLYNLGHGGYVEFVEENTCFGGSGNNGGKTLVSCCGRSECIHEIGHSLGLLHEQLNPGRDGYIRINYKSIRQPEKVRFVPVQKEEIILEHPFDISSPMGYEFQQSPTAQITLLTDDLSAEKKDFYMFQEISENHKCFENNCTNFQTECYNDGYVTMIRGACACRCPDGLNPATGCRTTLSQDRSDNTGCGGVFDLTTEVPHQTFTKMSNQNKVCTWLIRAPEGDTVYVDFNQFNLPKWRSRCKDSIEIRHGRIGWAGKQFCGTTAPKLIRSYSNNMIITYKPGTGRGRVASSFNFTVRFIRSEDICYNLTDKGRTYGGTVNYVRDYTPCVEWWRAVNCSFNPYNLKDISTPLESNYCRNPGNGLRPWCYTNAYTCKRKYCDVCHVDTPYDKFPTRFCRRYSTMYNYCRYFKNEARQRCAVKCRDDVLPPQPSVSTVSCPRPQSLGDDSEELGDDWSRSTYSVGESVTFRCMYDNRLYRTEMKTVCLSNGNWSYIGNTACVPCHFLKGFTLYNQNCYKIFTTKKTANQHQRACGAFGGSLADVRSQQEQAFITSLGFEMGANGLYIGANDMFQEGTFRFRNFQPVNWAPWNPITRNGPNRDCVWSNPNNQWVYGRCNVKRAAVCKIPMLRHDRRGGANCQDSRNDCNALLETDPGMCDRNGGNFAFVHCTRTCNKCFD